MSEPTAMELLSTMTDDGCNCLPSKVFASRVEKVLEIKKPTGSDRSDDLLDEIVRILNGDEA